MNAVFLDHLKTVQFNMLLQTQCYFVLYVSFGL